MHQPSRLMPKYLAPQGSWLKWAYGFVFVALWVFAIWSSPIVFGSITLLLVISTIILGKSRTKHLRTLAVQRSGESICTFAREANCRENDSWAVRAVYEQIQEYLGEEFKNFPVRWGDDFEKDLKIDLEDVEDIIAIEAAQRARRSLVSPESNPLYGKVKTVGDLVRFLVSQPNESSP